MHQSILQRRRRAAYACWLCGGAQQPTGWVAALWLGVRGSGVLPAEASWAALSLAGGVLGSPDAIVPCKNPSQNRFGPVTWHAWVFELFYLASHFITMQATLSLGGRAFIANLVAPVGLLCLSVQHLLGAHPSLSCHVCKT